MIYGKVVRIFVKNMIFISIYIIKNKSTVHITKVYTTAVSVAMWIT